MKTSRLLSLALLATLLGAGAPTNPGILPPQSSPHGQTYGDWSAAWDQWVLAIPSDHNPLLDATGQDAAVGQSGAVWFLSGDLNGGGPVIRTISIPTGKSLFFPIFNFFWTNDPEFGDPAWTPENIAIAREILASIIGDTDNLILSATLDGRDITNLFNYRAQDAAPFKVDLPEDNVLGANAGPHDAVIDGYYLFLNPLTPGHHTLHFTGNFAGNNVIGPFVQDITYDITVKAGK